MKNFYFSYFLFFIVLISGCQELEKQSKLSVNDNFASTIVESQFFEFSGRKDNVIEAIDGTVIVFPKGCFLDASGNKVNENVKVELAEALTIDKMILSNLTTTSDGKLLETDGMIYLNATSDAEQLKINPENPIYIEIPTKKVKPDMMVYKGKRNKNGDINWVEPKNLEDHLIPVDIFSLDFLPKGFREEVEIGLPFREFKEPTDRVIDSLYYFLEIFIDDALNKKRLYSRNTIYEGLYNSTLTDLEVDTFFNEEEKRDTLINNDVPKKLYTDYGVDPLKIKVIKSEEFQNTIIATREFEKRLKVMFEICRPDILDIYINNLDKNMWEIDSLAALALEGEHYEDKFLEFKEERKNSIEKGSKNAKLLREYYKKQTLQIKEEVKKFRAMLSDIRKEGKKKLEKVEQEYKKILKKREKHRMETYGFQQSTLGWINIDRGVIEKDWESQRLEVLVSDGKTYDKLFTYVFYKSIKSLYKLNSTDNEIFFVGNNTSSEMLIPKRKPAVIISIGYQDEKNFLGYVEFETNSTEKIDLKLNEASETVVKKTLNEFEINNEENSIQTDLTFMRQLSTNIKDIEVTEIELEFLEKLRKSSFPMILTPKFDVNYQIELAVCDPNPEETIIEEVPEDWQ